MSTLPTVAIIGRPNTGKSRLFNRLAGYRKAIVSETPGTTRDHIAHRIQTDQMDYLLLDTGGMGGGTEDKDLEDDVERQSVLALENADLILFTLNSQEELTASDFEVADILRKQKRRHVPVILVLTKCDNPQAIDEHLPKAYELNIGDSVVPVSAPHKIGIEELTNSIIEHLQALHFEKNEPNNQEESSTPKIALIGKPNAGKSSVINAFMSDAQRKTSPLLVSDIPGTTRDSTDTTIRYQDQEYVFIDTAGIKRRKSTEEGIETYAYLRSIQSLGEADITVLILDGTEPVSRLDKRIAGMATQEGKGLIILLNKIDLLTTEQRKTQEQEVRNALPFCRFAPILPCSATERTNLLKLFDLINAAASNRLRRIPTKELQRWYRDTVLDQPMGQLCRSKFITQADEVPPTFVLFVKDPKSVQVSQLRYLENRLRETFSFEGTPVRWVTKETQAKSR
jgi:GTP-binding protein